MAIKVYTLDQSEQWDYIVRSFKKYDVYWLSGYVKSFYLHGDGEPLLFFYEDNNVRGINVVMKRDVADEVEFTDKLPKGMYYDFTTPYGYGGWIIEGGDKGKLFSAYLDWINKNKIISEFVRFHPLIMNQACCQDFYNVIQLGDVVHMDLSTPEIIWNNITSKNRNMIRKAVKNNIKIYNGRFPEIYNKFRLIYNKTMEHDKAEEYYYFEMPFYNSLLEDLPRNAQVFWAEKDGDVIAVSIMIHANGYMNYHLSGTLEEFRSLAPTNLLLYEAALWGEANGYKTLYLGGGVGSSEDTLFKFKRSFYKGDLKKFFIGRKVYSKDIYNELVKMRNGVESSYFPLYRVKNREREGFE